MVVVLRYIDDIFFIWTEGEDKLEGFLNRLNNFNSNLKFTHEKSKFSVNFWTWGLVLLITNLKQIYFVNPRIAISFSILILLTHFTTKKSIVYSQGLRIKRLCSSPSTFHKHLENLKTWFCDRGYRQKVKRVSEKSLDELFERPNRKETGVLLVATYDPSFQNLSAIIRKYFTFLYAEEKVKEFLQLLHLFHFVLVTVWETI